MKSWEDDARKWLAYSLDPLPQELNEIDWKSSLSPNNKKLAQHISAFANHHGGGYLAFGVDDDGEVVGVSREQVDSIIERLSSISRDSLTPQVALDYVVSDYNGRAVLFVKLIESRNKPVHLGTSVELSFIRTGGTTRQAGRQELGALMLNSRQITWEQLYASQTMTAQEVFNALDYRKMFELLKHPIPSDPDEIISWMERENVVVKEPSSGKYIITNFGAVSSAYKLEDFEGLGRKVIRVVKYKGNNKSEAERETVGAKGYAIGFDGLIEYIMAMLPNSEIIQHALRAETSLYPEIALRELIANAIIHQDFSITGSGPMVELFENRIEIRNPGKLLPSKKVDRLIGTNPESRNEKLASSFRRFNICEERGSGFVKVVSSIELFGLPALKFEEGSNYFKVTLYAPKTFAEMSVNERVEACYQHAVIRHLSSESMTNATLRERLKMSETQRPQVSKLIKEAMARGKIKPKDLSNKSTKFAEYVPYWA